MLRVITQILLHKLQTIIDADQAYGTDFTLTTTNLYLAESQLVFVTGVFQTYFSARVSSLNRHPTA